MARDKKIIIGNWKMNLNVHESSLYLHKLSNLVKAHRDIEVVLAPSMLALQSLSLQVNLRQFKLAAQNFYWRDHGHFTGEVSASQLRGVIQYAIVGHSERRHVFYETDKDIRNKVAAAIRNDIRPILCIGETAWERSAGETVDVLRDQLIGGLSNITSDELKHVIIAYEPVWAIGMGQNAMPSDVDKAQKAIRRQIEHLYGTKASESLSILYGGSVTADSAGGYLAIEGIDGLLMGAASLDAYAFSGIVEKAHKGSDVAIK
ncbi:triose-phosphate isomerase [Candidatus Saccharibacteria bacterium]|nr:triose-phosphate isomerase [Candidatus Saccharibacteria bacterium]